MAIAQRHQPLADVAAGRHVHAQPARGVLMHEAPVGAHQRSAFGLAHAGKVAHGAVAAAIADHAGIGFQQARDEM